MTQILKTMFKNLGKGSWFVAGMMSLALGFLGAFLPLLPTTVFIIFAAFCFGKSSPKLQVWLENTRLFGPMILDWKENGAIALQYKIIAITMMVVIFAFSLISKLPIWLLLIQGGLMLTGALYILTRPHSGR